jgi:hypothetical protein
VELLGLMSGSQFDEEIAETMHVELEAERQHKSIQATVTALRFPQMWGVL